VASYEKEVPFHLFRWLIAMVKKTEENAEFYFYGGENVEQGCSFPELRDIFELWTLRFGSDSEVEQLVRTILARMPSEKIKTHRLHACKILQGIKDASEETLRQFGTAFSASRGKWQQMCCYIAFSAWKSTEQFPIGIRTIVLEIFEQCQKDPQQNLPNHIYKMIGRADLTADETLSSGKEKQKAVISWGDPELREVERKAGVLITNPVAHLRFPDDRRLQEAQKLLGTFQTINISVPQAPGVSDHDYSMEQHRHVGMNIVRVGARCVGRGMLALGADYYDTLSSSSNKENAGDDDINWNLHVPEIPRSIRIIETRSSITIDETGANLGAMDWLDFHSGVAAGLRVSPDGGPVIGNAWIVYNRPPEGASAAQVFSHAGLLMGLGLNGHLKHLSFARLFDYLARSHVMTSMGLLLGISAAMVGSMNNVITKLLSVHLPALHPPASADLEVPPPIQVSSLIGLGLLYASTCHRRICEILIAEIDHPATEDRSFHRESHALAAGLAIGWVTLGKGGKSTGIDDLFLENQLLKFIDGGEIEEREPHASTDGYAFEETAGHSHAQNPKSNLVKSGSHTNTNLTGGAAMIGLALMYLKTNDVDVSNRIQIPQTIFLLSYVRPDFLLLRCLCRCLVMWDSVSPTEAFLRLHIPDSLWKYGDLELGEQRLNEEMRDELPQGRDFQLAVRCRFYCITGCLLGLGITRAGSNDAETRAMLIKWIKELLAFRKSCADRDVIIAENCLVTVCLAASLVMAGSGDLELMRIYRTLSLRLGPEAKYGSHMMISMAIGFLFLGGSLCTLSTSNTAVAALVTCLFPVFPVSTSDNLFHLQALRHFWVLATEKRYLQTVDSVTMKHIPAQVLVKTQDNVQPLVQKSPCLIPERVESIQVLQDDYLNVKMEAVPAAFPVKVLIQSKQSAAFETNLLKYLELTIASASKGWNVALLRSLDKFRPDLKEKYFQKLLHEGQSLLEKYLLFEATFENLELPEYQELVWMLSALGFPPKWAVAQIWQQAPSKSALEIAMAVKGALPYDLCKFLGHVKQ
jgi:anaphase-promoting complex subunit 1